MKVQNAKYTGIQNIKSRVSKKEIDCPRDGVALGGTTKEADFLKMGDISKLKSSDFGNLDMSNVPSVIAGAALGGSLSAISGLPIQYTAFGVIGGAIVGGIMGKDPAYAKCTGVGTVIGATIGAGIGAANGFPASGIIAGGIGAGVGALCATLYKYG